MKNVDEIDYRQVVRSQYESDGMEIFTSSKNPDISKKFLNFENRTIPKLAEMKSSEISV